MTKQRFYYTGAGGQGVLTILARDNGRVKEVKLSIVNTITPTNVAAELSMQGTSQLTIDDARNVLAKTPFCDSITGLNQVTQEFPVENVKIGDQIYLHTSAAGGGGNAVIVEGYLVIGK